MPQTHIDKDRSYKMHGGKFIEGFNEELYEDHDAPRIRAIPQLHATKGFRWLSRARLDAGQKVEAALQFWPRLAAKLTGSSVGGEPRERNARPYRPHQGARECARRRAQMAKSA